MACAIHCYTAGVIGRRRTGIVFMTMLLLALSSEGQTSSGTSQAEAHGRISGHVRRSDSHAPLGGATITLQFAGDVVASVRTRPDGSYSFSNLDAKFYTLSAWKDGFVGRLYGVGRPNSRSGGGLQLAPGSSLVNIDFSLLPEPEIAQMVSTAIDNAHPDNRRDLGFSNAAFSPDGTELAFGVADDGIWLYDLPTEHLRRVVENGWQYVWSRDGQLYASFVPDRKRYVVATRDSISETNELSPVVAAALARWKPNFGGAKHMGEHEVNAVNRGHGFVQLVVRSPGVPERVIASGNWELETFLLNPARLQILYPEPGAFGSIVTYNVRTGKSEYIDFQSGESLRLLALTADGKLVAYTVRGPCSPNEWNKQWLLHIENANAEPTAANVCFIRPK